MVASVKRKKGPRKVTYSAEVFYGSLTVSAQKGMKDWEHSKKKGYLDSW